jgi:hypothetical protein
MACSWSDLEMLSKKGASCKHKTKVTAYFELFTCGKHVRPVKLKAILKPRTKSTKVSGFFAIVFTAILKLRDLISADRDGPKLDIAHLLFYLWIFNSDLALRDRIIIIEARS